ncbi:hypothetical protein CPB83DRAFT_922948 [Crepidotus variabilis]|uniref:Uncharacterized protein n=1 Tax=Crepidotus variabilis TaxID=179855 RepID=A0A9P6EJM4_9AGAR|nr:hypothetical protein CPB83DRAFT_922948 [Crepidotus variabilis]
MSLPSILMTQVLGTSLDKVETDKLAILLQRNILTRMRSYHSPWSKAICGVGGSPICGPLVPTCPLSTCADEADFKNAIEYIGQFSSRVGREAKWVAEADDHFALPEHAVVLHMEISTTRTSQSVLKGAFARSWIGRQQGGFPTTGKSALPL